MRVIQAIGHGRRLALLAVVVTITVVATLLVSASTGDTASPFGEDAQAYGTTRRTAQSAAASSVPNKRGTATQPGTGCDDYWAWAEMVTGVPREVQIVMTAIGYAAVSVPMPEPCAAG